MLNYISVCVCVGGSCQTLNCWGMSLGSPRTCSSLPNSRCLTEISSWFIVILTKKSGYVHGIWPLWSFVTVCFGTWPIAIGWITRGESHFAKVKITKRPTCEASSHLDCAQLAVEFAGIQSYWACIAAAGDRNQKSPFFNRPREGKWAKKQSSFKTAKQRFRLKLRWIPGYPNIQKLYLINSKLFTEISGDISGHLPSSSVVLPDSPLRLKPPKSSSFAKLSRNHWLCWSNTNNGDLEVTAKLLSGTVEIWKCDCMVRVVFGNSAVVFGNSYSETGSCYNSTSDVLAAS